LVCQGDVYTHHLDHCFRGAATHYQQEKLRAFRAILVIGGKVASPSLQVNRLEALVKDTALHLRSGKP